VAEILPRFRRAQEEIEARRAVGKALLEADAELEPDASGRIVRASADGHHRDRARGLPVVGRVSGGGASPGTDPLAALLRKEARGELRLR
jgi:hypothetical protein